MHCKNCGYANDVDATFCEKCGANLRQDSNFGRRQRTSEKAGMTSSTKLLIVVIVFLIAALGVTAGALIQMNKVTTTTQNNPQVSVNQSSEQVTYKADWHQVTSFSGTNDDVRTFSIKGQRFKVVMSATPKLNYATNGIVVDIEDKKGVIGSGNLNWGPNDALSSKEKTIELTEPPGTYSIIVYTHELQTWTVTIYDYY